MKDLIPPPLLRNAHRMTIAASFWPRRCPGLDPATPRLFEVEPGSRILAECHWQAQPRAHPTLVLVHGLEGSSRSGYMLGTAEKAGRAGFNVLRLNQRNCGGTEHLTSALYHSGMSGDVRAVVRELIQRDNLPEIFLAGFSMGGNLVLKMAGEMAGSLSPPLRAVVGVSPPVDLAASADTLGEPRNRLYQWYFIRRLKRRMRCKAKLFPDRYALDGLERVRTIREFDDRITARYCGFRDADDYYARSSARTLLGAIRVPTLILTAQDDPIVPFRSFRDPPLPANPQITLVVTRYGGHCAFLASPDANGGERFWSEACVMEFCRKHSRLAVARAMQC